MTRLKTVQYAFPALASLANNTLTNLTQITVYLPESSVSIAKAWVEISMDDIITATGGTLTTKTVDLRLGAASYTSTTNTNGLSNTGENMSFFVERDFTSHFKTNWTGTSMTCDVRLQINQSTGTTLGMVNVCCILNITYEYDDSSSTQLKTVLIPLDAPKTQLPNSKTSHDTIPALDTYLPESSKTYRNIFIVTQANTNTIAATDHTVTYELSSLGTTTTGNYESALVTDRWTRYVWQITSYITTDTSHTFNVWASITQRHHCMQAWLVVTYEFDPSATTSVLNSIVLPADYYPPLGGTSVDDYQRSITSFYVEESGVSLNKLAAYFFMSTNSNVSLSGRVGSGTFLSYISTGSAVVAGVKGLMCRNDSPSGINFSRGKNNLFFDSYDISASQRYGNTSLFWIVNYTSDKSDFGIGAHNHTVMWPIYLQNTSAAAQQLITSTGAIQIPESNYFASNIGYKMDLMNQGTVPSCISIKTQRSSGEGAFIYEKIYTDGSSSDGEAGLITIYSSDQGLFKKWPNDPNPNKLLLELGRKYSLNSSVGAIMFNSLIKYVTYHTITYPVSGNISNSNGGTVSVDLLDFNTKQTLLETTVTGNNSFSFSWYDNTEPVICCAYENNSYKGISSSGYAG